MQTAEQLLEDSLPVECAIARAKEHIMLCLDRREGREPVKQVVISNDALGWVCADGAVEHLYLTGESGVFDLHELIQEARSESGILVMEMGEDEDAEPISQWLMKATN